MSGPATFDLTGPLPTGASTVVLEASAGTGKTHAIASLATRYVADGVPLDELMLVTFGRAATVELRERVRQRMNEATRALVSADSDDPVLQQLATGTPDEIATRLHRLRTAVANFDAATISTTHGFCHQMLRALGVVADVDRDVTFVESASDLVTEVVTDLYLQAFGKAGATKPPFTFKDASTLAHRAVADRSAELEPVDAEAGSVPARRRRLAELVRDEVARRKRHGRVQDYDDLLIQLRDALADDRVGEAAQQRIRSRYRVVLVDEFQDTDPVQWEILRRTFHGNRTLVLIGDPKQAIYAFRGADVQTYLLATREATDHHTLGTNWRSDARLVSALQVLLGGRSLGDDEITVSPVESAHQQDRLVGGADSPLRLRVVDRDHVSVDRNGLCPVAPTRTFIAADASADIVALLESRAQLTTEQEVRPVAPADIAVLCHRVADGVLMRDALAEVGVPAVLTTTNSVFASEAATDWLTLLTAIEQPHRPGLTRAVALSSFVGWNADRLATAGNADLDAHAARLRHWGTLLDSRGVAAMLEAVSSSTDLPGRLLARRGGERLLTDLRHIGQSLHLTATRSQLGVAALVTWLQHRMEEAGGDINEDRSRRLDSDADAVQILTVWRSKGLEFPVVYAPFLWDRWPPKETAPLFHDQSGRRVRDVGGIQGPAFAAHEELAETEHSDEHLRLAYVALTRARCRLVTYWAATANTRTAPLHRLLFGRVDGQSALLPSVQPAVDVDVWASLQGLVASADGCIAVEHATSADGRRWQSEPAARPEIRERRFLRDLDMTWTRTSYSGLTAGLHDAPGVSSEAESPGTVDEPEVELLEQVAPADALTSPMADLPVGAAFGTLVHGVYEELDFTAPDLRAALVAGCEAAGSQRFAGVPAAALAEALEPSLLTPLGPLAGGRRLADFGPHDVLAEMEYEYPLAGGDRSRRAEATVGQIADLLAVHLPAHDPLRPYADDLRLPGLAEKPLRGFIGGFLDAILRVRGADGVPRYLVVDYKTNWLGARDSLTSDDYRPAALTAAMRGAHYPLQALLYTVALHRFLRWRQPGYDPEVHLGGVLYLFVRGMCGPDTPAVEGVPAGVFSWRPPASLVVALSDLLNGGAR